MSRPLRRPFSSLGARSRSLRACRCGALIAALACSVPVQAQPSEAVAPVVETVAPTDALAPAEAVALETVAEPTPEPTPEPVAAEASPPRPAPTRFGPASIAIPNGDVSLGFFAQLRSNVSNEGGRLGDGGRTGVSNLELRRVRLFVRGNFLDDRLAFLMQLSTSPSSLELLDLSLDGQVREGMRLRVGVFKTPFTLHRFRSFTNLPLTEWDPAAVRFGAERQYGVELHSAPRSEAYVDYSIGAFSGVNSRSAFARGVAETYDEPMPNASNLRAAQPPTSVHPELIGRIGYATAGAEPLILSDARGGGLRGYAGLSAAYDFRPVVTQDFTARIAAEGMLKVEHVTLNAVSYLGFHTPDGGAIALGMVGVTLDATYRALPRLEFALRYSQVATLIGMRRDAQDYVQRLLAVADPADVPGLLADYADAGQTRRVEEYAVGINVPIVGRSLVFQTDLALVRTDRVGTSRDADTIRWRSQVQFGF